MSSYGYANRGYTTYKDMDPLVDDHVKPRYGGGGGFDCSDHLCRPVIIDSEGRKQPIIRYTPNESYVVKREMIVEHVQLPMTEYKNYGVHNNDKWRRPSSPIHDRDRPHTMVERYRPVIIDSEGRKQPTIRYTPNESYIGKREMIVEHVQLPMTEYENYGVHNNDKWHRPLSPIHDPDHPHTMVERYRYGSPTKFEVHDDKWRRPSSPIPNRNPPQTMVERYRYGSPTKYEVNNDKWRKPSSPNYDRPHEVEEFITNVQTEVSQPTRSGPLTGLYQRNSANPTGYIESTDYGDGNKPSGYGKQDEWFKEPTVDNSRGWSKPAPLGWTKPVTRPLTGPTNNIGEAVDFLKEAVKSTSITTGAPHTRYNDGYTETIDSSEAKRRYAQPGTINSKEVISKYGGAFVPKEPKVRK